MNRWILRMLGLGVLITFMLVALKQEARAQQEPDRSPGLDRLFDLTSYQGMEEMPYFGDGPGANEQFLTTPDVDIPYSLIVFQSYRNESDWNIFLADGSGGNQTQLTWEASADIHPRLNRGCSKIVFASNRSGNYDIYTMNLDGSGVIKLTSNKKDDVYPAWSYDGTLIVFQSYRDGNPEIYTIYADGTNLTRLTSWKRSSSGWTIRWTVCAPMLSSRWPRRAPTIPG